jgi:hypothetical protein
MLWRAQVSICLNSEDIVINFEVMTPFVIFFSF